MYNSTIHYSFRGTLCRFIYTQGWLRLRGGLLHVHCTCTQGGLIVRAGGLVHCTCAQGLVSYSGLSHTYYSVKVAFASMDTPLSTACTSVYIVHYVLHNGTL